MRFFTILMGWILTVPAAILHVIARQRYGGSEIPPQYPGALGNVSLLGIGVMLLGIGYFVLQKSNEKISNKQ